MASFLVLAPRLENGQRDEDRTVFIRDGFAFVALIVPFLWLLVHRLWFEAALILAAAVIISLIGDYTGHDDMAAFIAMLLSLLVGLEANGWRAAALERRGYEQLGIVDADNAADAETIWFLRPKVTRPAPPAGPASVKPEAAVLPAAPKALLGGMVGLVSHRGEN